MFQKANSSRNFDGDSFDVFLSVKRVVDLHTKVFCFLDYFELIFANFKIQVFISTFEDIMQRISWHLFLQHLRRACCVEAKYPVV